MRLIDSDDLLTAFPGDEPMLTMSCVRMTIKRMPTVDAEPIRHGHWIMKPNGYGTCSNCNKCSLDIMGGVHSNYCPNCGALMDGGDEVEEQ